MPSSPIDRAVVALASVAAVAASAVLMSAGPQSGGERPRRQALPGGPAALHQPVAMASEAGVVTLSAVLVSAPRTEENSEALERLRDAAFTPEGVPRSLDGQGWATLQERIEAVASSGQVLLYRPTVITRVGEEAAMRSGVQDDNRATGFLWEVLAAGGAGAIGVRSQVELSEPLSGRDEPGRFTLQFESEWTIEPGHAAVAASLEGSGSDAAGDRLNLFAVRAERVSDKAGE